MIIEGNTPGTAGGPGGRDRTLAVKSRKNVREITFFGGGHFFSRFKLFLRAKPTREGSADVVHYFFPVCPPIRAPTLKFQYISQFSLILGTNLHLVFSVAIFNLFIIAIYQPI